MRLKIVQCKNIDTDEFRYFQKPSDIEKDVEIMNGAQPKPHTRVQISKCLSEKTHNKRFGRWLLNYVDIQLNDDIIFDTVYGRQNKCDKMSQCDNAAEDAK